MSFFGNDAHPAQQARQIKLGRHGSEGGDGSSSPNRPRVVVSFEDPNPAQGRRASMRGANSMLGASNLSGGHDASFNNLTASFNPNKTATFEDLQRRMNEESMLSLKTALEPEANTDVNATDASAARQQFLSNQRRMQRACHWGVIVQVSRFLNATVTGLNVTKAHAEARDQMNPRCLLGIRRAIRRVRLRLLAPSMTKPSVASVRNDKMLGLFSEAHIQFLVDNLEPKYFFAREGIIFMGSEDDECYVLFSGSADVMMGKIKVFTMTGGMVFGSVGMISGEPRTATILARENCLVWSISRRAFESYGARDHQVVAAQTIIRELRQKNIRSVYKGLIEPDYLASRFTMLKGCSHEGVTMLLAKSEPRVLKSGEVLLCPPPPDSELGRPRRSPYEVRAPGEEEDGSDDLSLPTSMDVLYILRGTVRIYRNFTGQISQEKCLEEHLTFMLELASKRHPGSEEDTISAAAKSYEKNMATFDPSANRAERDVLPNQTPNKPTIGGGRELICDLSGPMLLNLAPLVLGEPSPLTIETLGGCDILVLTNPNFHRLSEYDIATLRQNALNIHCPFVKPLARTPMLRTIFQSSLSFDFLSKLQTAQIHQEPFVFSPGSKLSYGATAQRGFSDSSQHYRDDYVAALILRGEIKTSTEARGTAVGHPLLWPDVTVMIFGCEPCEAVCLTRVEAILLRRADIIETLLVALNESQLDTLCSALTNAFVSRVGRRPTMELGGVHPSKGTTQGRWKHLVSSSKEMSRASRPVHVVQPPSRAPNALGGVVGGGRREVSFVRSHTTSGQAEDTTAPLDLYDGQKSGRWGSRHDSLAPSSTSGGDDDDYGDTPRGVSHRQSTVDFLFEPTQRGEGLQSSNGVFHANAGRNASKVFTAAYDPLLSAALASCEQYRQEQLESEYYDDEDNGHTHRLYRSQHYRPLSAIRPTSARLRINHHLAPRTRLTVQGGLRSGGGYPNGLASRRAGGEETLTMHHSKATVGVTDKQKLHRTLEEFFS
jgi:hypothetical protein